jgi:hypothetical protein
MDILSITMSDTTELELKHPTSGEKIGLTLHLRSMDHPEMKKITRAISDRALKLRARGKFFTVDEIEENTSKIISASVYGWEWQEGGSIGGKTPKFDAKELANLLAQKWPATQIDEALGDTSRFFGK